MAKLKAPLLSLGASGAIGKSIVYFPWKGLDAAREYVVPSNPKTTAQTTQRGYMTDAVADVHAAQSHANFPMLALDYAAYALWGSCFPTPRTWFNQAVKCYVDQMVASLLAHTYRHGEVIPGDEKLDVAVYNSGFIAGHITAGDFWYGTSKTALINKKTATIVVATQHAEAEITGLTNGVKYYWQFRPTAQASYVGCDSGIYYGTPAA